MWLTQLHHSFLTYSQFDRKVLRNPQRFIPPAVGNNNIRHYYRFEKMKRYLIPIIILSFCACSNPHKRENKQTILQEPDKADTLTKTEPIKKNTEEIRFTKSNGEAVLIGEKIELLDNELKAIADISNFAGKIVSIKGVSDSLFNQGKGYEGFCKSFWYVQIQSDTIKGIVNGRQVFKIH